MFNLEIEATLHSVTSDLDMIGERLQGPKVKSEYSVDFVPDRDRERKDRKENHGKESRECLQSPHLWMMHY